MRVEFQKQYFEKKSEKLAVLKSLSQHFGITYVNRRSRKRWPTKGGLTFILVGSTEEESSQQLRTLFSEHFFAPKLVA